MRKIKTLTLLALMLGSTVTTQAQEKQNDANWAETIGFLKNNISRFNKTMVSYNPNHNKEYDVLLVLEVKENFLIKKRGNITYKVNLKELIGCSINTESKNGIKFLSLVFTKNSVEWWDDVNKTINSTEGIDINLCERFHDWKECLEYQWDENDVFIQRIMKAFKHLAYLANEKRKESKF